MPNTTYTSVSAPQVDPRAIRTLARSIYRRMQDAGYSGEHMVDFASMMLDLVREDWKGASSGHSP